MPICAPNTALTKPKLFKNLEPIRAPRLATLLALVERRGQGIGELGATREEATAFASWRGPLASD